MSRQRQDAWTEQEDLILAETVLKHIREGSTQLTAFKEVGLQLSRTAAACGFRWNSTIRKRYEKAIALAKQQRKRRLLNKAKENGDSYRAPGKLTLDEVIQFLKDVAGDERLIDKLQAENEKLKKQINDYERELAKLREEATVLKQEYNAMFEVLDRARKVMSHSLENGYDDR